MPKPLTPSQTVFPSLRNPLSLSLFRLLLHTVAYLLWQAMRQLLAGTELARAQVVTLQCKPVKVAARVRERHRQIHVQLATSYPWQALWRRCRESLEAG